MLGYRVTPHDRENAIASPLALRVHDVLFLEIQARLIEPHIVGRRVNPLLHTSPFHKKEAPEGASLDYALTLVNAGM